MKSEYESFRRRNESSFSENDNQSQTSASIPLWRFVIPLIMQVTLIVLVPMRGIYTLATGKTAFLQTVPVDAYDWLRGKSVIFDYSISRVENLRNLPGWQELIAEFPNQSRPNQALIEGTSFYVILQEQKYTGNINDITPQAWRPVRLARDLPNNIGDNQVVLKGRYQDDSIVYGLEEYYIPSIQRQKMDEDISQARRTAGTKLRPIVVEIRVDTNGKALPVSVWVNERNYRF